MRLQRRLALFLPAALAVAGCSTPNHGGTLSASARLATALEASDGVVDSAIATMDSFERRAAREERAVGFALGRSIVAPQRPSTESSAAEAAGEVLAPAFTALGDYAHVLGQAAANSTPDPRPSSGGEVLAQAVAQALPRVSAQIAPASREAGVAGVAALARIAQEAPSEGRITAGALAQRAEPQLLAVTTLLKAVIGVRQGEATRGVIRARREAMEAAHLRLLEAARREPGLGAAGRYGLYHQVAGMRDQDPLPGTLAAIVTMLSALEEAHAAIAAGTGEAEPKVAAFEAALARLQALSGHQDAQASE